MTMYLSSHDIRPTGCEPAEFIDEPPPGTRGGFGPGHARRRRRERGHRDRLRYDVAAMAAWMSFVTALGWLTSERWPALTVSIVACARLDMISCWSGGIT
jgi:hypothetical protein